MLFARWRHHLRFASSFAYALFNAMVMKISKWSRIQDSCRITPKIETLVVYAMPDISKFQKDPFITFWVILYTRRQTNRQTDKVRQKHYLLGGGNNTPESIAANYRLISLLSVCYKCLKRLLLQCANQILEDFITVEQAGFRKGRSTCDQVLALAIFVENEF